MTPAVAESVSGTTTATSKPRVLFLVTEDWFFCLHRLALARAVRDQGYDVIVATQVAEHGERITSEGLRLIPIRLSRGGLNPFADLAATGELVDIYMREQPDIVHHVALKPILYGSLAAWISGTPAVINAFAGLGYLFTASGWKTSILRGFFCFLLRHAFAGTRATAIFENLDDYETLRARGIVAAPRSIVIRGAGVDESRFFATPEPSGDPVVLLAGRMLWDKGIGEFVEAARIVRSRNIPARFVLAGRRDPSNPSSISEEQLRDWEAEGLIEWWGERNDMPEVMRESHIFALPSYREGLPTAVVEAAACGRPVVATDVPGCREVVQDGENGFLVPVKDPQALAEALIRLLEDTGLRHRMGECGRKMVLDSFTERHVFSQVIGLYRTMLARRTERSGEAGYRVSGSLPSAVGRVDGPKTQTGHRVVKPRLLYLVTEDWYFCGHRMDLARGARDSGYEVIVATQVSDHADEITREGFKLIPIQLSRRNRDPISDVADVLELVGIYRKEKPDIVHHVGMKPIIYGGWAARSLREVAVVNAFAGLGYAFTGAKLTTRIARGAVVVLLKSTRKASFRRRAIFQNRDDFEALRACGLVTAEDATIVPGSGVAERVFVPTPEAPGDPVVLLAGRVLGDKGIREFVEAAEMIKSRGMKARFVVAGRLDPANPTSIPEMQLREWNASGVIEWWGQRRDMPKVLTECHIVALPSYREGFPKILLEAGASGRPVVATDVSGCREIVRDGENGFLVPVRDSKALAEALIKLIADPELRVRMGARGREIVLSGLTSGQIVPQILSVYAGLLREIGSVN